LLGERNEVPCRRPVVLPHLGVEGELTRLHPMHASQRRPAARPDRSAGDEDSMAESCLSVTGNRASMTYPDGQELVFEHDDDDRLSQTYVVGSVANFPIGAYWYWP